MVSEAEASAASMTVGLFREDMRPEEGAGLSVIVPANPLMLVSKMFAVPGTPAERISERWSALIPKSTTRTLTVMEWDRLPLVAVIVIP